MVFHFFTVQKQREHNVFLYIQIGDKIIKLKNKAYFLSPYFAHLLVTPLGNICTIYMNRAAIARALITNPEILFADEPTGNLDSQTGTEIMSLLQEINQKSGQTIVMVTHSPEAAKCSSRVITVMDGMIA